MTSTILSCSCSVAGLDREKKEKKEKTRATGHAATALLAALGEIERKEEDFEVERI